MPNAIMQGAELWYANQHTRGRARKKRRIRKKKLSINNHKNKETKRNGNGEKGKGRQEGMCVFRKVKGKAGGDVCCSH